MTTTTARMFRIPLADCPPFSKAYIADLKDQVARDAEMGIDPADAWIDMARKRCLRDGLAVDEAAFRAEYDAASAMTALANPKDVQVCGYVRMTVLAEGPDGTEVAVYERAGFSPS